MHTSYPLVCTPVLCRCLQLIARLGRWLRTALNMCYLRFFKPEGLLAAAGWPREQLSGFFDERFCQEVPPELVAALLPVEKVQAMVSMPCAAVCGTAAEPLLVSSLACVACSLHPPLQLHCLLAPDIVCHCDGPNIQLHCCCTAAASLTLLCSPHQVDELTREELAENPSAVAFPQVLDYLGRVAVQDACAMLCSENQELREAAQANKVIQFMLEQPLMR